MSKKKCLPGKNLLWIDLPYRLNLDSVLSLKFIHIYRILFIPEGVKKTTRRRRERGRRRTPSIKDKMRHAGLNEDISLVSVTCVGKHMTS